MIPTVKTFCIIKGGETLLIFGGAPETHASFNDIFESPPKLKKNTSGSEHLPSST